jgi:hypothetical protein
MTTDTQGWLSISTEGFASMNAARPPEHLIKELVQNSLDSFGDEQSGRIRLTYVFANEKVEVVCDDNGSGIENLGDLRVVYLTNKTDSHLKRGRFGRGFKEALCIADQASVVSGSQRLEFLRENGERVCRQTRRLLPLGGTKVKMSMPWAAEVCDRLDDYFKRFLVPDRIDLVVNGSVIDSRPIAYEITASLTTEIYDTTTQSWKKPSRKTTVQLVHTNPDETPFIFEMGIPVAPVEWTIDFHCDVQQRVPMNPNRDAVQSGYPLKLHTACLPTLLTAMAPETVKEDWVGTAGRKCEEAVQRQIIDQAFGTNIARSVPRMGERQFDEDARELGVVIVNTAQTSGGFREMLKAYVPSAMQVVRKDEEEKTTEAFASGFRLSDVLDSGDERSNWINQRGGKKHVETCLSFAVWLCQQLVYSCATQQARVTGRVALSGSSLRKFSAHWSGDNVLTLALEEKCFWLEPLGAESLEILIHEAAHAMNQHHGYEFRKEMERLAGVAASLMFHRGPEIQRQFATLDIAVSCNSFPF